jgi:hypothetical protein
MFCAACGKERHWHVAAAYPGPCECGSHVFTSDPDLGVGASANVQVVGFTSPIPVGIVTGPVTYVGNGDGPPFLNGCDNAGAT